MISQPTGKDLFRLTRHRIEIYLANVTSCRRFDKMNHISFFFFFLLFFSFFFCLVFFCTETSIFDSRLSHRCSSMELFSLFVMGSNSSNQMKPLSLHTASIAGNPMNDQIRTGLFIHLNYFCFHRLPTRRIYQQICLIELIDKHSASYQIKICLSKNNKESQEWFHSRDLPMILFSCTHF